MCRRAMLGLCDRGRGEAAAMPPAAGGCRELDAQGGPVHGLTVHLGGARRALPCLHSQGAPVAEPTQCPRTRIHFTDCTQSAGLTGATRKASLS